MEFDRKKENDPLKTVEKIRTILTELNILTTETWTTPFLSSKPEPHSFSVRVDAPTYGIGTNGKGSTRTYTLASAYGEFMERLQNLILLPIGYLTKESLEKHNFLYFPDEKEFTLEEIALSEDSLTRRICKDFYQDTLLLECGMEERKKMISAYQETDLSGIGNKLISWPFYSVKQDDTVYIWNLFATFLQGSNGMCAGNTPAEALVQGLSEIFERYVSTQVLAKGIVPPDMPKESYMKYETISHIIGEIENMGPFKILVKDCSLGKGLPVCAVALIDYERQRYCMNFGSHPHLPVAIERCLTELLQGYDPSSSIHNDRNLISINRKAPNVYQNVCNAHSNGKGIFPITFFTGKPSYEHTPFRDLSTAGNQEMLQYCIELAMTLSDDVLIRDVSYLGFPAYYIVIPGVSHYPTSKKLLRQRMAYASLATIKQSKTDFTQDQLIKLLVGLNHWECASAKEELPISSYKLKIAVLLMLKYYDELISYLEYGIAQCQNTTEKNELNALLTVLKCQKDGCQMHEIEKTITLFYSKQLWETIYDLWLCSNPLEKLLSTIPDNSSKRFEQSVNELFCQLKEKFAQTKIVQNDLRKIIRR